MIHEPSDDYLWDQSGEPDAYVRHLETLLGRYRFDRPLRTAAPASTLRWIGRAAGLAAAAVVVFAAYLVTIPVFGQPGRAWPVLARAGRPTVSGAAITGSGTLTPGGVVETDARSRAEIRAGRVGLIEVLPGSRVRLVSTRTGTHRLGVDRGRIAARLWAPPFTFGFSTPAADAFDVGCAFTMEVDDHGVVTVRVTSGWVQLDRPDRTQLIPEGAVSTAKPGKPLGTPVFEDASPAFKRALRAIDEEPMSPTERAGALSTLMAEARSRDVYTLLRLNRDLTPPERGALYDRAAVLKPPPARITRDGIMADDGAMLDAWRRTLGLPEVKRWWVHWMDALEF